MTDEQILKLAETYFEESFVEYDEDDNEVVDFIASKENLLKFARTIYSISWEECIDRWNCWENEMLGD